MLQGSMLNTLLNRVNTSSPKQVELTPGQVFKGTVLKLYPDNSALVQIGGLQVHAKLETNLAAGQKAWLQVQPNSDVVTLKVLNGEQTSAGASLEGLIRSLGIADTKENRAIVQTLVNANLPVNKEMIKAFGEIAKSMDISKTTIDAFLLAVKRNLPLTKDVIGSLKAFLSEQPLTQTMQTFLTEAEKFLKTNINQPAAQTPLANGGKGTAGQQEAETQTGNQQPINQQITQTVQLLKEKLESLPLQLFDQTKPTPTSERRAPATPTANNTQQPQVTVSSASNVPELSSGSQQTNAAEIVETSPRADQAAQSTRSAGQQGTDMTARVDKSVSNTTTATAGSPAVSDTAADQAPTAVRTNSGQNAAVVTTSEYPAQEQQLPTVRQRENVPLSSAQVEQSDRTTVSTTLTDTSSKAAGIPQDRVSQVSPAQRPQVAETPDQLQIAEAAAEKNNPLKELFRHLGVMHERQIMNHSLPAGTIADGQGEMHFDSVKALLLQVTQATGNSIPSGLRESADQLLQQITGQQLVLAQQPNTSALSQVVIQVPLRTGEEEDTAYVQIEAKKRDSGQLDADNCRLLFNLDLQQLGITMVDVLIVKKIINVQIYNDQPWLDGLAYQMKEQFHAQLRDVGYQLSSMRVQPLPEAEAKKVAQQSKGKLLSHYKGMDVRI